MAEIAPAETSNLNLIDENIDPYYNKIFLKKPVTLLSYGQLVLSFLAILSEIITTSYPYVWSAHYNPGAMCGVIFGLSASFGIWAGHQPSKCTIVAHMVFSIISACICIPVSLYSVFFAYFSSVDLFNGDLFKSRMTVGIFISLAVIALIQCIFSIASSALSCSAVCCHEKPPRRNDGMSDNFQPKYFVMEETNPVITRLVMTRKPVVWMSTIQIVLAIVAVILNVFGMIYPYKGIAYIGTAIWCGIPFGLCGAFGIWAGMSPSKCSVLTFMVFAVISICFSLPFIVISFIGLSTSNKAGERYYYDFLDSYVNVSGETERKVTFGLFLSQALIALVQFLISVNSSAMACQPICCPTSRNVISCQLDNRVKEPSVIQADEKNEFQPRVIPISSGIPAEPFLYRPPQELVYLSATHASLNGGMQVYSTSNTPDIY